MKIAKYYIVENEYDTLVFFENEIDALSVSDSVFTAEEYVFESLNEYQDATRNSNGTLDFSKDFIYEVYGEVGTIELFSNYQSAVDFQKFSRLKGRKYDVSQLKIFKNFEEYQEAKEYSSSVFAAKREPTKSLEARCK